MHQQLGGRRFALYALFALSGFAGLIYESIWTHYLKLFLGHAAYAQSLVLAIFMGGLALGAWLAGRWSGRLARPLVAYAAVEGALGVLGLLFDPVFRGLQAWAFDTGIPAMPGPLAVDLLKWGLSAALIAPQCVLLGATFPLMSAGVVRLAPQSAGRELGWLYFTNSLGAAIGVIASGFVLVELVGLPGTLMTAGLLNLLVVLLLLPLLKGGATAAPASEPTTAASAPARLLLAAAFLTGAASFFYEIGWIRMLSLVLGSATHSFELMLSAFILGLALGSFWIRRRIEAFAQPLRALGWIQAVMATLALATIPLYGWTFEGMKALMAAARPSEGGYVLFNLFSHAVCLVMMLPVTICAGMTLPLITATLLRAGGGERAIGQVYAINTAGAITGVLLAVHVVMPLLGLRQVIVVGAAVDLALGAWLLLRSAPIERDGRAVFAGLLLACAGLAALTRFDPVKMASGVFRMGVFTDHSVTFHRDGKTASVDVLTDPTGEATSIATNGKVDAMLLAKGPSVDDYTMILASALPLLLHENPRRVAVIGFGSGRSTHALLHDPRLEVVDTIEIEPAMVEGARHFGERVRRAYEDPRSHIHIEDAKTWFARHREPYDLIISEPSNPWVSGVASLFSTEFYAQVRRQLAPGGLMVQWLQGYEIDERLFASVLGALDSGFADYQVYVSYYLDYVIVARADGPVPELTQAGYAAVGPELTGLLDHAEFRSLADLQAHRVGGRQVLAPLVASYGMPANSDYFPIVDQRAVRERFLRSDAMGISRLQPHLWRLESAPATAFPSGSDAFPPRQRRAEVKAMLDFLAWRSGAAPAPATVAGETSLREIMVLETMRQACGSAAADAQWVREIASLLDRVGAALAPADARLLAGDLRGRRCYAGASAELKRWVELLAAVGDGQPAAIRSHARALLEGLPSDVELPRWVVAELLFAHVRGGTPQSLLDEIQWFGLRTPRSLDVRLLEAHARAALQENP